jgi:hypothetical protein
LGSMYVPVNYETRASLTGDIEWMFIFRDRWRRILTP